MTIRTLLTTSALVYALTGFEQAASAYSCLLSPNVLIQTHNRFAGNREASGFSTTRQSETADSMVSLESDLTTSRDMASFPGAFWWRRMFSRRLIPTHPRGADPTYR